MGHTEVTQTPGRGGNNGEGAVAVGGAVCGGVGGGHGEVAQHRGGVVHDGGETTSLNHTEAEHNQKGEGHDDGLDEVGGGHGQEATEHGVEDDDDGAHDHGGHIVNPEEGGEQLADGGKPRGGVGDEENHDNHTCDGGQKGLAVPETLGEELWNGDGLELGRIATHTLCHEEPVEVGAHSQTNGRPTCVGDAS